DTGAERVGHDTLRVERDDPGEVVQRPVAIRAAVAAVGDGLGCGEAAGRGVRGTGHGDEQRSCYRRRGDCRADDCLTHFGVPFVVWPSPGDGPLPSAWALAWEPPCEWPSPLAWSRPRRPKWICLAPAAVAIAAASAAAAAAAPMFHLFVCTVCP